MKKIVSLILSAALLLPVFDTAAWAVETPSPEIEGTSAIIVDVTTGDTLWSQDADTVRPVASMTKAMAAYLVYEAIHNGQITMETAVPISTYTYYFSRDDIYSNIPFEWEETYTVEDMLEAFLCYSSCAAGPALGELIYGSEEAFVAAMNTKAQELGLNASFDQSYDEGYMSARAMATLASRILSDCPEMLEITSRSEFEFAGETYGSSNALLDSDDPSIGTVDGLKTGWTPQAGSCMCATAVKDGHRLITVTMNARAVNARYSDSEELLRTGFELLDAYEAEGYTYASPHTANVSMNGGQYSLHAYLADGNNYVRLRDLAALLDGTGSQFGLEYIDGIVSINNGASYDGAISGDLSNGKTVLTQMRQPVLTVDGVAYTIDAYLIDGLNYMKIRDLAAAIGCGIEWDGSTGQVVLLPEDNAAADEGGGDTAPVAETAA